MTKPSKSKNKKLSMEYKYVANPKFQNSTTAIKIT